MKAIIALCAVLSLASCATSAENARSLMDRLEFEGEEYGTFELSGTVDVNPAPFFSTNVHVKLEKHKDKPEASTPEE